MFLSAHAVQAYIATGVTDLRKSINGLAILVADQLALDPLSGHLFAFCNRKRDLLKVLYWDRNGFCLWQKRLERDRFRWPESEAEVLALRAHELSWLLDGMSLVQREAHRPVVYECIV